MPTSELSDSSVAEMFEWILFPLKKEIKITLFLIFYLIHTYCYNGKLPREIFFKFDQVCIKHHYDNVWDFSLGREIFEIFWTFSLSKKFKSACFLGSFMFKLP